MQTTGILKFFAKGKSDKQMKTAKQAKTVYKFCLTISYKQRIFICFQITGIMTQGRGDGHQWVTAYLLSYSLDAYHWKYCTDVYSNRKVILDR